MAKTILDKAVERFVLNAVSSMGRTVGKKISDAVNQLTEERKAKRKPKRLSDEA